jgi:hypothetical protein
MAGISTKLTLNASDFVRGIDRSKKSANSLKTSMSSIGSGIGSAFSGITKSVGAIGIAATGAAAAIGGITYKLISMAEEGIQAENRIKNVVKTMGLFGDQSDDVADRLIKMADATELATGVDGDLIMASQAKLATFKELAKTAGTTGGAFDRATQASLDMAAVFGGDASNYAVQLGKALEDPEKGLAALKRTGALTTSQIKAISEEFAATGNRAKAFDQVLKAIETQVGGSANATASGMARIKVSVGQMLDEIGKPMAEVFSQFAADVAAMTPQIIASLSGLAPKIREVGSTLAAALSEGLAGDTSRLVKIGELMGEAVALGFKVAITRGFAEATESALRLMEDYNPIRKMSKWSQDTFGNDPFFNQGKLSEEVSNAKGPIMENQIGDGIERIQNLFKEISVGSNPKKITQSEWNDKRQAIQNGKKILPTEPDAPEGPSAAQQAKAEELRLAQEQYRLEAEMVRARIAGDEKKIADLERQKAIQEEIVALNKLGMTGDKAKDTAAKMVDARAAADEADKAREKKQQGGPSAGVSQLGSVAKATNVLMGRAANDGILEESRRQTSLLRTIKENTKPKTTNPEIQIPVFA